MNDGPRLKPASTDLRRQVALTVALQVLAAAVMGGPLLVTGALVNDRLGDFYLFRDTLHSLNVYGEFPWWNPSIWAGFPSYYLSFLYWPGREPLAAAMAMAAWLLGRLHVTIPSYHAIYVAYFAFLVPLLLSLSVLALARQILRRPLAVYLVVVLMAFSPGVVLSISDAGTDVAAYGFFFAAALLHFLRRPTRSRFLLMCLPAIAMAAALTYVELFWNSFFVPVFIALVCVGRRGLTRRATRALRSIPGRWWAAAAAGVCLCALPSLVAYGHGTDILSSRADDRRYYSYEALRPGTPLEALAISTPGVGFEWTGYYENPDASFDPQPVSRTSSFSSYGYMGLLTLPLVCIGLVLGRPYWSIRLYGCIAGVLTIVLLSAYSPIFSLLLGWPSPLRGDHFSDLVFRQGFFALFVLAAGLGLEALLKSTPTRRWILIGLFAAASAASVAWLVSLQGPAATHNYVFGLALALILLYGIGLTRLALARTRVQISQACIVLLALTLVDTSTLAFAHLRLSLTHARGLAREPDAGTIGSVVGHHEGAFLHLRGMNDTALLSAPAQPVTLMATATGAPLARQDVAIGRRSYNSIAMRVHASQPSRLEWRDAYFPFWRAWVNGAEAPVQRTPEGMKAVLVPPGGSDVIFRFSPSVLRVTVAASYLTMAAALVLWVLARRTENR